jgi:hypothetical protein
MLPCDASVASELSGHVTCGPEPIVGPHVVPNPWRQRETSRYGDGTETPLNSAILNLPETS